MTKGEWYSISQREVFETEQERDLREHAVRSQLQTCDHPGPVVFMRHGHRDELLHQRPSLVLWFAFITFIDLTSRYCSST
jgi:hypothetical protein